MKSLYVDFDEDKIISNLEDVVPLFPLGNMVFFPNTVIPLHIFEERQSLKISYIEEIAHKMNFIPYEQFKNLV